VSAYPRIGRKEDGASDRAFASHSNSEARLFLNEIGSPLHGHDPREGHMAIHTGRITNGHAWRRGDVGMRSVSGTPAPSAATWPLAARVGSLLPIVARLARKASGL
jgi:hypothetical protein